METDDPRVALGATSVATRCAAARDLAAIGDWSDLDALVARGWTDKSMAVRLYAAAAAADIAQRSRPELTTAQAQALVQYAFGGDPGHNPSMLMLVAPVETTEVLTRLGRILRDPRSDVRLGVLTALRRMVLSARSDRDAVARAIAPWFDDAKVPSDAHVELARIVGEAGLASLRALVQALRGAGDAATEVADQALDRLDARASREAWIGAWWSDGRDVFENRAPDPALAVAVCDGHAWYGTEGTRDVTPGDVPMLGTDRVTRIVARPLGAPEALPAVQVDGRVWWAVSEDAFAGWLDAWHETLRTLPEAGRAVIVARGEALGGAGAERVRAAGAWIAGDLDAALEAAEAQLARKRARGDAWFWRARVRLERADLAGAREDLEAFADKVKSDNPLGPIAARLAAGLGA